MVKSSSHARGENRYELANGAQTGGLVVNIEDSQQNDDFAHHDPLMDAFIIEAGLNGIGFITQAPTTITIDMQQTLLDELQLETAATLVFIPEGNQFNVKNGKPTGLLDSIAIEEEGGGIIYSVSFKGMHIEDLLKMKDDFAALKGLFNKNDLYNLANGNDVVSSLGGNDEVNVGGGSNVVHAGTGNDEVSAIGAASGNNRFYGEAGNDRMDGWNGKDVLIGAAGADTLFGWGNNDKLDGGKDADRLTGGAGADILTGGAGRDIFDFNTFDAGATKGTRDTITDFHRGEDKLELAQFQIDGAFGDKLAFIGGKAFTDSGQVRFDTVHGDVVVEVNYQGSKAADFEILLKDLDQIGRADLIL